LRSNNWTDPSFRTNPNPITSIDSLFLASFSQHSPGDCTIPLSGAPSVAHSQGPTYTMAQPTTSFYRRPLPENLPDLSSTRGKELFAQAMVEGHTRCFFPLVSQFHTQTEPAFCGNDDRDAQLQWRIDGL